MVKSSQNFVNVNIECPQVIYECYFTGLKDSMFESDKVMANRARFFNTMNNFLTWCALRQYINYASRPFRKAHQEFYKGLMGGKAVDQRYLHK